MKRNFVRKIWQKKQNALEISADMVLADVLKQGYVVKNSLFSEDMKKLSQEDRERIYLVIETLIKYSQK